MNPSEQTHPVPTRRFTGGADLHSHVLPGIDDGARNLEISLAMLRRAARFGTQLMAATPHRWYGGSENAPATLRRLTAEVNMALEQTKLAGRIRVIAGQEIPLTPNTAHELRHEIVMTYGDNGVTCLVEPPFDRFPDWMGKALRAIVSAGFRPVLAHPERNGFVMDSPERAQTFTDAGAMIQLTAMSVEGRNGALCEAASHWLLERSLVTIVASDCHSPDWRPPILRNAFRIVEARYGLETARRLFIENPRKILSGEAVS